MAWSIPPAFPTGMTAGTSAALQKLSDDLAVLGGVSTAYVPTLTNLTLGNGTMTAECALAGKLIRFLVQITFGSASAVSGGISISLPATAKRTGLAFADCALFDASSNVWYPAVALTTATVDTMNLRVWPPSASDHLVVTSATVPFTWGTGDTLSISGIYEAA